MTLTTAAILTEILTSYGPLAFGVIVLLVIWRKIMKPELDASRGEQEGMRKHIEAETNKLQDTAELTAQTAKTNQETAKLLLATTKTTESTARVLERCLDRALELKSREESKT